MIPPLLGALLASAAARERQEVRPSELIAGLFQSAREALREGEPSAAESDARLIVSVSLDQLGALYSRQRRWREAERAYRQASRASAFSAESLMGLGIVYLRSGQYEKGRAAMRRLIRLDPLNPMPRHLLGKIHFMAGDYRKASGELRDAYALDPDNASVAYTLALAYLQQGRPEEAKRVFSDMEKRLGASASFHVLRGRAFRETGRLDDAIEHFREAIRLDDGFPRAHYYLGLTLLMREDREAFPQALEEFAKELKRDPEDYLANFFTGLVLFSDRRAQEALPYLRKAAAAESEKPDPHLFLGQALLRSGDTAGAIAHLRKAIELTDDPQAGGYRVSHAHFTLGQALLRSGNEQEGRRHIEKSRELKRRRFEWEAETVRQRMGGSPQGMEAASEAARLARSGEPSAVLLDVERPSATGGADSEAADYYRRVASSAYQLLARIDAGRSRFGQAADFLEMAAGWDDSSDDLYFNWGLARLKAGDDSRAVPQLMEALRRDPSNEAAKRLLAGAALSALDARQADSAMAAAEFLLQRHPEVADLHLLRGRALAGKGDFKGARQAFQSALERDPDIAEAHYFIGTAWLRQSKLEEALRAFDKELGRDPLHARSLYHKAFVLTTLGRVDEATPLLEKAIQADREYAEPYYQLGKIQLKAGKLAQATMNLETAARLDPGAPYVFYQLSRAYSRAGREQEARDALSRYRTLKKAQEEARLDSMRQEPVPPKEVP